MGKNTAAERRYPVTERGYLLEFLLAQVRGKSRNAVKHLLSGRQVAVDGKIVTRFDWPLEPGEVVTILSQGREEQAKAPFPILYQDRDLIAIDKPAGLLTVGHEGGSGSAPPTGCWPTPCGTAAGRRSSLWSTGWTGTPRARCSLPGTRR